MNKRDTDILAIRQSIIQEEIQAIRNGLACSRQGSLEVRNACALEVLSASAARPVFARRSSLLR